MYMWRYHCHGRQMSESEEMEFTSRRSELAEYNKAYFDISGRFLALTHVTLPVEKWKKRLAESELMETPTPLFSHLTSRQLRKI